MHSKTQVLSSAISDHLPISHPFHLLCTWTHVNSHQIAAKQKSSVNFFTQSFLTPPPPAVPPPDTSATPSLCDNITFLEDDVYHVLSHLDVTKAVMEIDHIPNYVLKSCATTLTRPIYHLFQQCVSQLYIPSEWKTHKITPIFKSGNKLSVKNYHPIFLLCCISKVLKKLVYNNIYEAVLPRISTNQSGFLHNRPTVQQLLKFLHSIHESLSHKDQTDVIYFDIRKSFDSVFHDILLDKLHKIRVTGLACNNSRKQCVSVINELSEFFDSHF